MTDRDLQDVFGKIARLKALESQPGTPEEAAAATAAINRLATRYNLTQMQLANAKLEDSSGIDKYLIDLGAKSSGTFIWRQQLMMTIAETNFCRAVFGSGKNTTITLIGQEHNCKIVEGLYDYLTSEIMRLAEVYWKSIRHRFDRPSSYAVKYKAGFYMGAMVAVREKLEEQFRRAKEEFQGSSSLVLVNDEQLDRAVLDFFPNITQSKQTTRSLDTGSYVNGLAAGSKINLAKQIEGAS